MNLRYDSRMFHKSSFILCGALLLTACTSSAPVIDDQTAVSSEMSSSIASESFDEMIAGFPLYQPDQVLHDPLYHNAEFGFSFRLPATWTTYSVRKDGFRFYFGIPLSTPSAEGKMFDVYNIEIHTPEEWEKRIHECVEGVDPMCLIPDEIGRTDTHVFGTGQFYMAGGWSPCFTEDLETHEPYFHAVVCDEFYATVKNETYDMLKALTVDR